MVSGVAVSLPCCVLFDMIVWMCFALFELTLGCCVLYVISMYCVVFFCIVLYCFPCRATFQSIELCLNHVMQCCLVLFCSIVVFCLVLFRLVLSLVLLCVCVCLVLFLFLPRGKSICVV